MIKISISKFLNFSISSVTIFLFYTLPAFALHIPGHRTGGSTGGSGLPPGQPITLDVLDYIIFRVSTFFISISGVLALIFIIWAGVTYMYAGEDTTQIQAAQGRLKSGIIGAAIILGVGVIIQTIASVVTLDFFCSHPTRFIGGAIRIPCFW